MKTAVIGIGSNSVRMLIAEVKQEGYQRLFRDREGTRLFAGLDAQGKLSPESMQHTARVVARMASDARGQGCETLHVFATSASRDARNSAVFLPLLQKAAGTAPEILSGEEEAVLGFLGATDGCPVQGSCGVIDIGGGSTELVTGRGNSIDMAFSCQMGAVRLYGQYPIHGRQDIALVCEEAARILEEKLLAYPFPAPVTSWVGTGGTFTCLAAMVKGIHWTERTFMHGTEVSLEAAEEIAMRLSEMTLEERRQMPELQPSRADIVVHGICILLAIMKRLQIERLRVSEYGNLEGYIRKRYLHV